jgi:hypothetical protein
VILIDSDVLIAHLRGLEEARHWPLNVRHFPMLSDLRPPFSL